MPETQTPMLESMPATPAKVLMETAPSIANILSIFRTGYMTDAILENLSQALALEAASIGMEITRQSALKPQ